MSATEKDFDSVSILYTKDGMPITSTPRYPRGSTMPHQPKKDVYPDTQEEEVPKWIRLFNSGTISRFLSRWRSNPIHVPASTSHQLPHPLSYGYEHKLATGDNNNHTISRGMCTIVFVLFGILLVSISGGLPLLLSETLSQQQLSTTTRYASNMTSLATTRASMTDITSLGNTNYLISDSTTEDTMQNSTVNDITQHSTLEDTTPYNTLEDTTPYSTTNFTTINDATNDATQEGTNPSEMFTQESTTNDVPEGSTMNVTSYDHSTVDTSQVSPNDGSTTEITDTESTTTQTSTVMKTQQTTQAQMIEDAYAEMANTYTFRINDTGHLYCKIHLRLNTNLNISVTRITIAKYNTSGKYNVINHDLQSNMTSYLDDRFSIHSIHINKTLTEIRYRYDTTQDGQQDVCDLPGAYSCEYDLSDSSIDNTFANSSLTVSGPPSGILIEHETQYNINSSGTLNCSANTDQENGFDSIHLVIGKRTETYSYLEFKEISNNTGKLEGFPTISLLDKIIEGDISDDCLTRHTIVYGLNFDSNYTDIRAQCIAEDLSAPNDTFIETNITLLNVTP